MAEERCAEVYETENDFAQMARLTNKKVKQIGISGGETLLHKNITDIMRAARRSFPKTAISIGTNGIALLQMDENFWKTCRDQHIDICVNHYPIKIDHAGIEQKCRAYTIDLFKPPGEGKENEMFRISLNPRGDCNGVFNFSNCVLAEGCLFLKRGKLYPCPLVANIEHFNHYFKMNIPVTDNDSLDIYKTRNLSEVLEFLNKPIPFCNFCDIEHIAYNIKWEKSKKTINEWSSNTEDVR